MKKTIAFFVAITTPIWIIPGMFIAVTYDMMINVYYNVLEYLEKK